MTEDVSSPGDMASTADLATSVMAELSGETPDPVETTTETAQPSMAAAPTVPQSATPPETTATTESAGETEKPVPGPVDYKRFTEVNERMKAAEARLSSIAPVEQWHQEFQKDPVRFFLQLGTELHQDPNLGADPRLRSLAGRTLRAARPTAPAETPDPMPQADLQDTNGHGVYSEKQMQTLLQWQQKQLLGEVQKTIAPIQAEREQAKALAEAKHVVERANGEASALLAQWRQQPGWTTDNEPQIKQRYAALVKSGTEPRSAIGLAYSQIVVPTLSQRERQAVTSSLQTKTSATTVSPERRVTAPAKSQGPRDTRDITREVFAELRAT